LEQSLREDISSPNYQTISQNIKEYRNRAAYLELNLTTLLHETQIKRASSDPVIPTVDRLSVSQPVKAVKSPELPKEKLKDTREIIRALTFDDLHKTKRSQSIGKKDDLFSSDPVLFQKFQGVAKLLRAAESEPNPATKLKLFGEASNKFFKVYISKSMLKMFSSNRSRILYCCSQIKLTKGYC
jgi:hypothetical protein